MNLEKEKGEQSWSILCLDQREGIYLSSLTDKQPLAVFWQLKIGRTRRA